MLAGVQNTADPAALEDFIRRFGNTKYGNLARARLADLNAKRLPPEDPATRAWAAVQNTKNPAALADFIRRFPNSIYAILARARLAELNAGTQASPLIRTGHGDARFTRLRNAYSRKRRTWIARGRSTLSTTISRANIRRPRRRR